MPHTADNVLVGVNGGVNVAPSGTTLPTNAMMALNTAFADVGYISDDGVAQSIGTDVSEIKAWQNGDVVRKIQTSHDLTYQLTMIETSATTLLTFYGNHTAGTVQITGDEVSSKAWVLNVIDGDEKIRIVIPDGQITERGDVVYKNDEPIGYPVTITCYPDSNGVKAYLYRLDAS